MNSILYNRALRTMPYLTTLYYIEIIYLMFILLLAFGKTVSVSAGFLLAFLLTVHIIMLNSGKKSSSKIQLLIMDIHGAYSITFLSVAAYHYTEIHAAAIAIIIMRSLLLAWELLSICVLTSDNAVTHFS